MKISILLPYKENYSPDYAGAVSLFVFSQVKNSRYKNNITVFGSTQLKTKLSKRYININLPNLLFKSKTKEYLNRFIHLFKKNKSDLIEIHNRPSYVIPLRELNTNIVLYYHNDPTAMLGSQHVYERIKLIDICSKIIFNSNWSKLRFLKELPLNYKNSKKLIVIHQSINKKKIQLRKKKKNIIFVGKLNYAKGYDLFGSVIVKILDKYSNWSATVIGDEEREKYNFTHKKLLNLGFVKHKKVLNYFEKSSIAVVCSRWEEPFGRTSLEASSRGCAVIISNRGGLPETIKNPIKLKSLTFTELYNSIEKLIINKNLLIHHQKKNLKEFYLTDKFINKKIDNFRDEINFDLNKKIKIKNLKLKIIHITNFNERHNGRLYYNTGRRINNGLIKLGHNVLELSDRDIISYSRNLNDIKGSKKLNQKLIEINLNFQPDLILLGHADQIEIKTLELIKKQNKNVRMAQWFLDRMDEEWSINKKRFLHKMKILDASFCTTNPRELKFNRKKVFYLPNPVDDSIDNLKIFLNKKFYNDVFFAMSHGVHRGVLKKGKLDKRSNLIEKLINDLPNLNFSVFGLQNIEPIWSDNFIKELKLCKIGLNISQGTPGKFYSSDRFSQLIGNGLLVFIDKKTKIGKFFSKDEIIEYNNYKDLKNKLIFYSKNEHICKKIAKKGHKKYFKFFNSKIISNYIISRTFDNPKKFYWEKFL